jgi:hypothetical protein
VIPVIRYAVTHEGQGGERVIAHAAQGRFTYDTAEEAAAWIVSALKINGPAGLARVYNLPLRVGAFECYPGHHDPVSVYPLREIEVAP